MGIWDEFAGPSGDEEKWRWDTIGKTLEGEVTRLQVVETKFGRSPVATIVNDDGEWAVWISQANLQREMAAKAVTTGDKVRITFVEEIDTGKGNPAKIFDVKVKRGDTPTPAPEPTPAVAADDDWD